MRTKFLIFLTNLFLYAGADDSAFDVNKMGSREPIAHADEAKSACAQKCFDCSLFCNFFEGWKKPNPNKKDEINLILYCACCTCCETIECECCMPNSGKCCDPIPMHNKLEAQKEKSTICYPLEFCFCYLTRCMFAKRQTGCCNLSNGPMIHSPYAVDRKAAYGL